MVPATFYAFDILALDGQDNTALPYLERRALLDGLALADTSVQAPPYWIDVDDQVMLDIAREHGLEGIVAKRLTSTYHTGRRSSSWIKSPLRRTTSVVVCGWDPGPRGGLRALVLGARNPAGDLCHIGHVGTGFSAKDRRILRVQLEAIEQPTPPFTQPLTADAGSSMRWVRAVYVGDIEYREFTGHLRAIPAGKDCGTYPHPQSGGPAIIKGGCGPVCGPDPGSPASALPLPTVGAGGRRPAGAGGTSGRHRPMLPTWIEVRRGVRTGGFVAWRRRAQGVARMLRAALPACH